MKKKIKGFRAVHLTHCNYGQWLGSCKYGDTNDCPAMNKKEKGWLPQSTKLGDLIEQLVIVIIKDQKDENEVNYWQEIYEIKELINKYHGENK